MARKKPEVEIEVIAPEPDFNGLTDGLEREICEAVELGVYPQVAAQASGVPRSTFYRWLQHPGERYRLFARRVAQAHAKARAYAEKAMHATRPGDWLVKGPGKATPDNPGWGDSLALTGANGGAVMVETTDAQTIDLKKLSADDLRMLREIKTRALPSGNSGEDNEP